MLSWLIAKDILDKDLTNDISQQKKRRKNINTCYLIQFLLLALLVKNE